LVIHHVPVVPPQVDAGSLSVTDELRPDFHASVELVATFDPHRLAALRRWIFANAAPVVTDDELLDAVVLVIDAAVTAAGETAPESGPVEVTLWRGPTGLRCEVTAAAPLAPLLRTRLPADPRVRGLWSAMQTTAGLDVDITSHENGSWISVTLPPRRWS
jgi:hypothetical protein